jgi:tRNA(fMet)-specific endonuclease VapC
VNLLIDSDIVIDVLRRHIAAIDLFQRLGSNSLFLSAISVGEVVHGIHSRVSAGRDEELFRQFLKNVDVVPFDYEVAVLYGALRFRLRRAGNAPGDPGLMIAAKQPCITTWYS